MLDTKVTTCGQMNGRVDIMGPNMDQFQLFDNPGQGYGNGETTSYKDALTGNWQDNVLSDAFFSKENIDIIQNGIRAGIYRRSNGRYNVGNQDLTNLKIIMRSIFLQYAANSKNDITGQIRALNDLVLEYCIPNVYNECVAYIKYKHDASTLVVPEQRPRFVSTKGDKVLELKPWF
jgi:hypothetical protein